ncbi:MAG: CAP domain-containing protein, partial [Anaerolineae bacterium]|nr:CAP domain-containing protein [Anaerolineae bacterium]
MARLLTVLSFVLLAISLVLIIQFGVPAIVARGIPQSTPEPIIPATLPETQATTAATLAATAAAAPTIQSKTMIHPEAAALVNLLNEQRKAAGLSAFTTDDALTTAATRISTVMARGQTLAKDQIETAVRQGGYPYKLLWTSSISATNASTQQLFDAWLRDAQSQQNWQNADFKDVGLGITQDSSGQRHYVILLGAPMTLTAPGADINQPGDP